jgi:hypothetical protein
MDVDTFNITIWMELIRPMKQENLQKLIVEVGPCKMAPTVKRLVSSLMGHLKVMQIIFTWMSTVGIMVTISILRPMTSTF